MIIGVRSGICNESDVKPSHSKIDPQNLGLQRPIMYIMFGRRQIFKF